MSLCRTFANQVTDIATIHWFNFHSAMVKHKHFVIVGTLEQVQEEEKRVMADEDESDEDDSEDIDLGKVCK